MSELEIFLICVCVLFILGFFMLLYLNGNFTISETQLVDKKTVDVYNTNLFGVRSYSHEETIMVYKITYLNQKIKYKTISYKH